VDDWEERWRVRGERSAGGRRAGVEGEVMARRTEGKEETPTLDQDDGGEASLNSLEGDFKGP
jgi:hypothetical protein